MRITDNTRLIAILRNNEWSATRLSEASRHASAGAKVLAPSDDAAAYTTSARRGSTVANLSSRTRIARSAADELGVAERALDSATELLAEAKTLAIQGANETMSPNDRKALAMRVAGIRDQILELANTRGAGGYVFGGTRTDVPPFSPTGAFGGNDTETRIPVTDGVAPRKNVSGAKAFTAAGGTDVFAELNNLANALTTSNVTAIRTGIDTMQASHDQVVAIQVDAGLSMERLRSSADVLEAAGLTVAQSRSRDIGADDLAGMATELAAASSSYSQSLTVTKKLLSLPSLAQQG